MSNPWVAKWYVASYSDPDKEYTVAVRKDGTWGCSCPRWKFRRADLPNGECKHIDFVKDGLVYGSNNEPDEIANSIGWHSILTSLRGDADQPWPTPRPKPAPSTRAADAVISELVLARKVRTRAGFLEL